MANPKLVVDIEVCLASIDKGVEKYKKQLGEIEKYGSNIGLGDDFKKQIQEGIAELQKLKTEAIQTFKELSKGKLDSSEYTKFVKEIESKMAGFNQRITMIEQTITNLSKQLGKLDKVGELSKKVANLQQNFNRFTKDVKESIVALKEFNNVVSGQSNNSNIKETIKDYEKLVNILEGLDFGSKKTSLKTADISKLEKQFSSLYDQYTKLDTALNDSDDSQFIEKTQREIAELLPKLSNVFNAIVKIKNIDVDFGGDEIFNKVGLSFKDIANELNTASSDIQVSFSQLVNKLKTSAKDVSDEVNTVATTMFQIKDGKIQIPVVLDENSIKTLRPKYKELIELLQKYADVNPVDVTMRLFPLNTTKKGQAEVKEAVKNINAQIANLPEGELKTSMTELYNNLEQQYQKALTLKIAVELSEDEHSVNKNLKAIQDAVNEQGITIYPKIVITDEEADQLSEKLKKLQEGFTFNITSEIKEMANSLNTLLKQGNTKEWVEGFISGLDQIEQKISVIEPLVNDLSTLMFVKKNSKGKNNTGNIPTEQDVNVILAFTEAMTSLKAALDKQSEIKVDIDTTDIVDKIGVLKAHLGLIFGQLIDIRAMLDKRLGNQVAAVGKDLVDELQKAVDNNEPLKIPITPDLSTINEFISKIESAISQFNFKLNIGGIDTSNAKNNNLRDILKDANNANDLFHKLFYGLDEVAGNLNSKLVREIAFSLVKGIKAGLSSTSDMIREGLKGTNYESITEQLIGDEETLNTIKKVANEVTTSFANSFNVNNSYIDNFINDIEDKIINSGRTIHLPISVMESSIDGFINEIQSAINSKSSANQKTNDVDDGTQISSKRQASSLKGQITKIANRIVNDSELDSQKYETLINKANEYIEKLRELGVETSEIEERFNNITESARLKFKPIETSKSADGINNEKNKFEELQISAEKAAKSKEEFVNANKDVFDSIVTSLKALNSEGDGFKNLNNIINKLSDDKSGKIDVLINNLKAIRDLLSTPVDGDSFVRVLESLSKQGDNLKDLATVLKASKKEIERAKAEATKISQDASDTATREWVYDLEKELSNEPINKDAISISPDFNKADSSLQLLSDLFEEVSESIQETSKEVDNNTEKLDKNTEAQKRNHNIVSTQYNRVVDPDGNVIDTQRSFKAEDTFGRRTTVIKRPEYDDQGNETGRFGHEIKETTDYVKVVNQAASSLSDMWEAERRLRDELSKNPGKQNIELIDALNDRIAECTRRYNEATNAARQFDSETGSAFAEYYNDVSQGSDFNYNMFDTVVNNRANSLYNSKYIAYQEAFSKRAENIIGKGNKAVVSLDFEIDKGNHIDSFNQELETLRNNINSITKLDFSLITEQDLNNLQKYLDEFNRLQKQGKLSANKAANQNSIQKYLAQVNDILSSNTKASFKSTSLYKEIVLLQKTLKTFKTGQTQEEVERLSAQLLRLKASFNELDDTVKGKNFLQYFLDNLRSRNAQLIAQYMSWQDIVRYFRQMISTIIELDTQLIDLRKTTKMSTDELNKFYYESNNIAKQMGVTTSEIISQAAAWSRLNKIGHLCGNI